MKKIVNIKLRLQKNQSLYPLESSSSTLFYVHKKTKERIIIRTCDHWICRVPNYIRTNFLEELSKVKIFGQPATPKLYPSLKKCLSNQFRHVYMVKIKLAETSSEWTISSEHLWGIPIPVFYIKGKKRSQFLLDKHIISYISNNIKHYGSDIWWKWNIEDLLPVKHRSLASKLEKSNEVFDVWFESGCSWYAILINKIHEKGNWLQIDNMTGELKENVVIEPEIEIEEPIENKKKIENDYPADMICEGHDQNDGLIQASSLLAGIKLIVFGVFSRKKV